MKPASLHDPQLAPTLTLEDRGTNVLLAWSDPSEGQAHFVVIRTDEGEQRGIATYLPGVMQAVVDGLDPDADRYCY